MIVGEWNDGEDRQRSFRPPPRPYNRGNIINIPIALSLILLFEFIVFDGEVTKRIDLSVQS
jgi:hypothetical protein